MSKTNQNASSASSNASNSKNFTAVGTMPNDLLKRHKLPKNLQSDASCRYVRCTKEFKQGVQQLKAYRQMVHKVNENRLAKPLVYALQYLSVPMMKYSGRE